MDLLAIYELIFRIINGERHEHYDRTVKYSEELMKLITGEDLDSLLVQFVKRENEDLFQQRKDITQHITPAVCKNLMDVFYKVPRSNSIQRVIGYDKAEEKNKKTLIEILERFWGDKDHDMYLGTRFIELNMVDPNAFFVLEWDEFLPTEHAKPYPFEVKSKNAVMYEYINNVLQYLVDMRDNRITFYGQTQTVLFDKITNEELIHSLLQFLDPAKAELFTIVEYLGINYMLLDKDRMYVISTPIPHELEYVPAFRVGYNRDLATDGQTFVNPFHAAICYLKKTLKLNSELDLSSALVAFPQQLRYVQKDCSNPECYKGHVELDGRKQICSTCNGTGLDTTTSVQEVITMPLPADPDDMYDLEKLIAYKTPPVEILKWQEEAIERLTAACKSVVFNSDIFDKKEVAETATGKNLDSQNVYDTLYPFVVQTGDAWKFIIEGVADITDLQKGLHPVFIFQKDFKLKSMETLISELSAANTSGADTEIKNAINNDIVRIIYEDNPLEYLKYQLKQQYNPFKGKTPAEISLIINGNLTTLYNKVLYTNIATIFDEIENETFATGKNFYEYPKTEQAKLIDAKVKAIMKAIAEETPEPTLDLNL